MGDSLKTGPKELLAQDSQGDRRRPKELSQDSQGDRRRPKELAQDSQGDNRRTNKGHSVNKVPSVRYSEEEQVVKQHLPPGFPRRQGDIYLSCQAGQEVVREQQERARRLLQELGATVWLHSLGPSIPRAISLAGRLQREEGGLQVDCFTSTRDLTDNWAVVGEVEGNRHNSGLHIRLTKCDRQNQ